ncbi:MAG: GNAT family N-acetyltransferase [Novosphingobium sp.]
MTEDLIIRPLERCNLPAALAIQSEVYPSFLVEPADAFASRLNVSPQFCLAAVSDGELVGYLLAHGWPRQSPPPVGAILSPSARSEVLFIHDLAVGAKGRGLALGQRLVNRAFELAAHQKLVRAELIAVEGAAAYWRSFGFAAAEASAELEAKVAVYGAQACWMTRSIPSPSTI